ncbi:hypothetical protein MMC26_000573 [Xylographa opegraphella]|nr:hypothetical protein [Xylographa opegraphella]
MPAPTANEADIIFNRANVALAKSQRLIASWLPPRTEEELRNAKSEAEVERDEQEMFAPVPELLGLGAPLPQEIKSGDERRQEISSNDKLRKQLLGKEFAKLCGSAGSAAKKDFGKFAMGSKPRPVVTKRVVDEEQEEFGRSSLGKPKRKLEAGSLDAEPGEGRGDENEPLHRSNTRGIGSGSSAKRRSTYLDEVLAEKLRKKKKKKGGSALVQQTVAPE